MLNLELANTSRYNFLAKITRSDVLENYRIKIVNSNAVENKLTNTQTNQQQNNITK